jgi:hypothetical protein
VQFSVIAMAVLLVMLTAIARTPDRGASSVPA